MIVSRSSNLRPIQRTLLSRRYFEVSLGTLRIDAAAVVAQKATRGANGTEGRRKNGI